MTLEDRIAKLEQVVVKLVEDSHPPARLPIGAMEERLSALENRAGVTLPERIGWLERPPTLGETSGRVVQYQVTHEPTPHDSWFGTFDGEYFDDTNCQAATRDVEGMAECVVVKCFNLKRFMKEPEMEWDQGVVWDVIFTWDLPLNERQLDRLNNPGRNFVVSVRPVGEGTWLAMPMPARRTWEEYFGPESDPDLADSYEVRFGVAPKGWIDTIGEFDGW